MGVLAATVANIAANKALEGAASATGATSTLRRIHLTAPQASTGVHGFLRFLCRVDMLLTD